MSTAETLNNPDNQESLGSFDPKSYEQEAKNSYRFGVLGRVALMATRGRKAVRELEKWKAVELASEAKQAEESRRNRGPLPNQVPGQGLFDTKPSEVEQAEDSGYIADSELEPVDFSKRYRTPESGRRSISPQEATKLGVGLFSAAEIRGPGHAHDIYDDEPLKPEDFDRAA